jgi:hypothetical protein
VLFRDCSAGEMADRLQADVLTDVLLAERADLSARLAAHQRRLTASEAVSTGVDRISYHRRSIRHLDFDVRSIDRMLRALDERFGGTRSSQGLGQA